MTQKAFKNSNIWPNFSFWNRFWFFMTITRDFLSNIIPLNKTLEIDNVLEHNKTSDKYILQFRKYISSDCRFYSRFFTPSQILWWGIVITFVCVCVCLSVCLCVTLSVNMIKGELSIRFWWKLVRLCIIIIGRSSC